MTYKGAHRQSPYKQGPSDLEEWLCTVVPSRALSWLPTPPAQASFSHLALTAVFLSYSPCSGSPVLVWSVELD